MHAGVSTLVAVLVLAGATMDGYVVLFKCMFGMVGFGVSYGMCFLPCCLQLMRDCLGK